jgi:UPF0716 family protein affecting phage T7 exclusion
MKALASSHALFDWSKRMPRRLPIGLLLFLVWVAAEVVVFQMLASRIGGAATTFLFIVKPVLGIMLVGNRLKAAFRKSGGAFAMRLEGRDAIQTALALVAAVLLAIPGFVAGLIGLALLSPQVRGWIAARFAGPAPQSRDIELDRSEWTEKAATRPKRVIARPKAE